MLIISKISLQCSKISVKHDRIFFFSLIPVNYKSCRSRHGNEELINYFGHFRTLLYLAHYIFYLMHFRIFFVSVDSDPL